jgi:type II secretory pathway pseudopilin PulG
MVHFNLVVAIITRSMKPPKFLRSDQTAGFTLIEALVVVIMVAALAAIAAPSWVGFLNNQRVGTARSQIADTLRKAQDEAKRTKAPRAIVFDNNTNNRPRMAIVPLIPGASATGSRVVAPASAGAWIQIGNSELKANTVQISTRIQGGSTTVPTPSTVASISFDENGAVLSNGSSNRLPAAFIIGPANGLEPRRCVIVQTLLGAMSEASGNACNI